MVYLLWVFSNFLLFFIESLQSLCFLLCDYMTCLEMMLVSFCIFVFSYYFFLFFFFPSSSFVFPFLWTHTSYFMRTVLRVSFTVMLLSHTLQLLSTLLSLMSSLCSFYGEKYNCVWSFSWVSFVVVCVASDIYMSVFNVIMKCEVYFNP